MSESEFMQVAVLRYADACIPPNQLQPDCPYVEPTDHGYACKTQCRDIQRRLLRLGTEPRAASSFDAGMLLQVSRSRSTTPGPDWHPVALLAVFAEVMESFPFVTAGNLHRTIDGTQALGELALLGLDPHALLGAFANEYALVLDVAISFEIGPAAVAEQPAYRDDWARLRQSMPAAREQKPGELDPEFHRAVGNWVRTGDPEWVVARRPPESLPTPASSREGRGREAEYRWLIERLTKTYLDEWSVETLEREYRYLTRMWEPSEVPTALVDLRRESRAAVADAWAKKVTSSDGDPETIRVQEAFTRQAINLVQSDDTQSAVTLLRVACELHPDDWMLANNYGFCLIPLDPTTAIESLARARGAAPDGRTIPLVEANDALAHIRAGNLQRAAEIVRATAAEAAPEKEYLLWVGDAGRFDSELEARLIPLQEYWALLAAFIERQESSSSPSAATGDAAGQ